MGPRPACSRIIYDYTYPSALRSRAFPSGIPHAPSRGTRTPTRKNQGARSRHLLEDTSMEQCKLQSPGFRCNCLDFAVPVASSRGINTPRTTSIWRPTLLQTCLGRQVTAAATRLGCESGGCTLARTASQVCLVAGVSSVRGSITVRVAGSYGGAVSLAGAEATVGCEDVVRTHFGPLAWHLYGLQPTPK